MWEWMFLFILKAESEKAEFVRMADDLGVVECAALELLRFDMPAYLSKVCTVLEEMVRADGSLAGKIAACGVPQQCLWFISRNMHAQAALGLLDALSQVAMLRAFLRGVGVRDLADSSVKSDERVSIIMARCTQ